MGPAHGVVSNVRSNEGMSDKSPSVTRPTSGPAHGRRAILRRSILRGIFGGAPKGEHELDGSNDLQELDLRRLDRLQLLQLLKGAMEENERLRCQLAESEQRLREYDIVVADSESLAEASLRLAGVFQDAQHAIDIYKRNIGMPVHPGGAVKTGGGVVEASDAGGRRSDG